MQQPSEKSSLNASTPASEFAAQHHLGNRRKYPDLLCSSYPSPPMSRPTTPVHEGSEKQSATSITTDSHTGKSKNTDSATQPILSPTSNETTRYTERAPSTSATIETSTIALSVADTDHATSVEPTSTINTTLPNTITDSNQAIAESSSIKSTRKAKQHVASACVNCKRAHLSCDVRRPCQRCINTGKQDSCHDVQHKKRGRPRLREDTDIVLPSSSIQPMTSTITPQTQHRPIASTRSRRAESFRSHQSRGSESSSYGPMTPNSATFSPLYAPYQFMPGSILPAVETPTALLDLDLRVLRFNSAFQQVAGDGRSMLSVRLSDIVRPLENSEPLLSMRDRLRAEREQREPAFLPPIVQSGRDPLDSVQDSDIDRFTQGFSDVAYTWMFQTPSSPATVHPVRVRLGKALTYFVVVTLQPMQVTRPTILHSTPAHLAMSTPIASEMYAIDRQTMIPATGLVYDQVLFTSPRASQHATTNVHQHPHQHPQYPILIQPIPSQHITSMSPDVVAQHPQMMQQGQPFVRLAADPRSLINYRDQLPPIAETTAGASRPTNIPTQPDGMADDDDDDVDDDEAQTAKRRRGMGIDDVLQ